MCRGNAICQTSQSSFAVFIQQSLSHQDLGGIRGFPTLSFVHRLLTFAPFSHVIPPPSPLILSAQRDAERAAKESAKRFQVNATIATKTAEDFKYHQEKRKELKKESIETAKMNKSGVVVSIHETAPEFKRLQEERKAKKKESVGKFSDVLSSVGQILPCGERRRSHVVLFLICTQNRP